MKIILSLFLLLLSTKGVFSESVSVTEGDSVTLHTGLTDIQNDDVLDWTYEDKGEFDEINGLGGKFKGRVEVNDSTGDLTIRNLKTTDTGVYKLTFIRITKIINIFNITVKPAVAVGSISVMVQDSVTLHADEIQRYDGVQWKFIKSLVAEINSDARIFNTYDGPDGRFRDRLQLECLTGSLTITNTKTIDSGLYEVDISSTKHTIHKTFTLSVSGALESENVKEGDPVTLNSTLNKIEMYDLILWMFEDTVLAKINQTAKQSNGDDKRFKNRLNVNHQTGSLTIKETIKSDSGLYKLQISNGRCTILRRITVSVYVTVTDTNLTLHIFAVIVFVAVAFAVIVAFLIYFCCKIDEEKQQSTYNTVLVIEGETVSLAPFGADINELNNIRWRFNSSTIAEFKIEIGQTPAPLNVHHNFKDRLVWTKHPGPLIIENLHIQDSGLYELQNSLNDKILKTFHVVAIAKTENYLKEVKEGGSFTLESGVRAIQRDEEILWKFGLNYSAIAAIQGGTKKTPPFGAGKRFKCRLKLDDNGSLTIKNSRPTDTGFYLSQITRSGTTSWKLFMVKIEKDEINSPLCLRCI
ncbi:hypothetical protein Q8A67_005655 [Cirrhinus molitorella]|uniref:Immunoglobulin domain-containing protein n=1 Tax=Cirrhinus molitorella TaxID=172907 RepID=A0AA88TVK8_9TELE|nr:hypothetical protein Q8A67_005655 [Cirrhinus molitorella]